MQEGSVGRMLEDEPRPPAAAGRTKSKRIGDAIIALKTRSPASRSVKRYTGLHKDNIELEEVAAVAAASTADISVEQQQSKGWMGSASLRVILVLSLVVVLSLIINGNSSLTHIFTIASAQQRMLPESPPLNPLSPPSSPPLRPMPPHPPPTRPPPQPPQPPLWPPASPPLMPPLMPPPHTPPHGPPLSPGPPGPPPPTASVIVEGLNARWLHGQPSNDLQQAGVIMWVVDGDGRDLNGFNKRNPWVPLPANPTGDRHSASMVTKRHPYIFACFACHANFRFNPGLVLTPSPATLSRLMCSYSSDPGSWKFQCRPSGRNETPGHVCRPGCQARPCGKNPPYRFWGCSWEADNLGGMMRMHDTFSHGYHGPIEPHPLEQLYNELVFSSTGVDEWEPDLPQLVEAVFVQARSNNASKLNGWDLRNNLQQQMGASGQTREIPLVEYDPSAEVTPFQIVRSKPHL
jgi:hypothetical protein